MGAASGADLELLIKTRADLKGARELEGSLKTQIASLKKLGQDASGAEAQLKKVQAAIKATPIKGGGFGGVAEGLKNIRQQGGAAASAISGVAGIISGPLAAGVAVFTAIASALRGATAALHEYAGAQERATGLDAALAQQGHLAEEVREKYQELAGELQRLTSIADDEWLSVLARLTQFGSNPDSIGMDVEAVKNLAGVLNGDVQQAALMVGKAIQGNFVAFSRWGIAVDQNATQAKKLDQLYRELAARGGGQLEARAKTLNGQWRALGNATSDLMEGFGGLIARTGILQAGTRILTDAFEYWAEKLSDTIPAVEGLTNAQRKTVDVQEELEAGTKRYEKRLEAAKREAERFAEALARVRSESEALTRRQDEQNNARMALELAIVDDQEKRGRLQAPTAVARRAAIREKYDLKREESALRNDLKQIQVNADELRLAQLREAQTKAELVALQARRKAAEGHNQSEAGRLDKLLADLEAQAGRLVDEEGGVRSPRSPFSTGAGPGYQSEIDRIQFQQDVTAARRRAYQARRDALGGTPENVAVIDAEIARTKERLTGETDARDKLQGSVPAENRQIVQDAGSRASVNETQRFTSAVEGGGSVAALLQAAQAGRELDAALRKSSVELIRALKDARKTVEELRAQVANGPAR